MRLISYIKWKGIKKTIIYIIPIEGDILPAVSFGKKYGENNVWKVDAGEKYQRLHSSQQAIVR